jgi:hypothetical protein
MCISSGSRLHLGPGFSIEIPGTVRHEEELHPLEKALLDAKPGDLLKLGRSTCKDLPRSVSRVHATVRIVASEVDDDGSRKLIVQVTPGIAAKQRIHIQHSANEPEVV